MKFLLLAIGGYVLYEYFYGTPTTVVPTSNTNAGSCVGPPWYTPAGCAQINGTFTTPPSNCGAPIGTGSCINASSVNVPPIGTAGSQPGYVSDPTPSNTTVVSPSSVAATSLISTSIQTQLQQLANSDLAANPTQGGLNVDQWNYYLAQITGVQLTGAQGEQLILALGESDSTRGTLIPLSVYLTALSATGLGGLSIGMARGLGLIRRGRVGYA